MRRGFSFYSQTVGQCKSNIEEKIIILCLWRSGPRHEKMGVATRCTTIGRAMVTATIICSYHCFAGQIGYFLLPPFVFLPFLFLCFYLLFVFDFLLNTKAYLGSLRYFCVILQNMHWVTTYLREFQIDTIDRQNQYWEYWEYTIPH